MGDAQEEKGKMKKKTLLIIFLLGILSITFSIVPKILAGVSEDGIYWTSGEDPPLVYPLLPSGTYDIVYDTEPEAMWGPILFYWGPQHLRVRFTPHADGQLVREARIAWAGQWGGNNTFEIHLVDANTGLTKTTPVITEPDPNDWKAYDVSDLAFYTDGDFYIEFWAIGAEIGVYTDDILPIYGRSEVNNEMGWYYPSGWEPSDFKIRAVVETTLTGDINGDGIVDVFDLRICAKAFGSKPENINWNPLVDLNNDGLIDIFDLRKIAKYYGEHA